MSAVLITLPCTARQLEAALHSYCDHHGAWDMRIMSDAISSGRSIQDTRITLALSEGSGESSPSPSSPTSSALVNSAAIREALEKCRDLAETIWQSEGGEDVSAEIAELKDRIDAALAKPARNCDRFGGDYKMLHTAWFDWTGSPSGQNPDGTAKMAFGEWLLAPAIKKGGAK